MYGRVHVSLVSFGECYRLVFFQLLKAIDRMNVFFIIIILQMFLFKINPYTLINCMPKTCLPKKKKKLWQECGLNPD